MKTTTKKPTKSAAAEVAALREDVRLMREANRRREDHLAGQVKELREGLQAAWEVLALACRADELEKRRKGASKPDEALSDEETALFIVSLGCRLRHDERIEAVLESLRNRPKSSNG
jgi:hypothetical protein